MADIVGFGMADCLLRSRPAAAISGRRPTGSATSDPPPRAAAGPATTLPRKLADVNGDAMADIVGFGDAGAYLALASAFHVV